MRISAKSLALYYEAAIRAIRQAGMRAGSVTVVLPVFTEQRTEEFLALWEHGYSKYDDCVFDLHLYQCFESRWHNLSPEKHFSEAQKRTELLKGFPACCVGEWSLALPQKATEQLDNVKLEEVYRHFAMAQLEAYESATHGWFFWTWNDRNSPAWNMKTCLDKGIFQVPAGGRPTSIDSP